MAEKPHFGANIGVPRQEIDYLVCGACQQDFPLQNIVLFMQHKKFDCDDIRSYKHVEGLPSRLLLCKSCPRKFTAPWRLLQHAQRVHALLIYMEEELWREEQGLAHFDRTQGRSGAKVECGVQTDNDESTMDVDSKPQQGRPTKETNDLVNLSKLDFSMLHTVQSRNEHQTTHSKTQTTSVIALPFTSTPKVRGTEFSLKDPSAKSFTDVALKHSQTFQFKQESANSLPMFSTPKPTLISIPGSPWLSGSTINEATHIEIAYTEPAKLVETSCVKPVEIGEAENAETGFITPVNTGPEICGVEPVETGSTKPVETGPEMEEEEEKCCDDQACGITLMPVTHEQPKKCCNAVVPKKRKRHMQVTHMAARRRNLSRRLSGNTNLIIDIDSSLDMQPPSTTTTSQDGASSAEMPHMDTSSLGSTAMFDRRMAKACAVAVSNTKSVIINPGTTFSIPVSMSRARSVGTFLIGGCQGGGSGGGGGGGGGFAGSVLIKSEPQASVRVSSGELDVSQFVDISTSHHDASTSGQAFAGFARGDLREHQMSRDKKRKYPTSRPYKCDHCELSFNQRIHLRKHQSKHTGVKPFQCQQCDYSTVEKSHLKVHIRVHTGEKPFKCTYCEYATAQNSTLKIHLKRHHLPGQTSEASQASSGAESTTSHPVPELPAPSAVGGDSNSSSSHVVLSGHGVTLTYPTNTHLQ